MTKKCDHIDDSASVTARTNGCEECLAAGAQWVHLRVCLTCGHAGCCDDSNGKHATAHFQETGHPVIQSLEPGEAWRWCYIDEVEIPAAVKTLAAGAGDAGAEGIITNLPGKSRSLPLTGDTTARIRKSGMFKSICQRVRRCNKENFEPTIELAVEIAREGREGRRIGTLFTFGDADSVLAKSRPLILDPMAGHPESAREIRDLNLRGTIKELAQLDGAFVVSDQGIVVSACRYLDAMASNVQLPFGMASRHLAGASISSVTDAVAIVVSESSMVRVFDDGELVAEIIPELWLMDRYNIQMNKPYEEERVGDLAVLTAQE
jgi:diadenylate cyclase